MLVHKHRHWLTVILAAVIAVWVVPAAATEFRSGDAIHITSKDILDDLFAAGGTVMLDARIAGDAFAAARTVTLGDSGVVDNSLMAMGQRIDVDGRVRNSARLFGQQVTVRGHIERNLMAFCQNLMLDSRAWIENDVNLGTAEAIVRGRIGGDLKGEGGRITLYGQIDGDVNVTAEHLVVMPTAIIGGALKYRSDNEVKVQEGAQILGGVERLAPKEEKGKGYTWGCFLWDVWWFLGSLAVGGLLLVLFGPFVRAMQNAIVTSAPRTFGLGILFVICLPIAAVALVLTLVGIPVALAVVAAWLILLYTANIFVGLALGDWLLARLRGGRHAPAFAALLVGLLLVTLISAIPYLCTLVKIVIWCLAFGAFFLTAYRYRTHTAA